MLAHLYISNYAIIDQLKQDFGKGLTVITGETGAGKSILLGALRLVLGERADSKSIGPNANKCVIEAHFDLSGLSLQPFFEENDLDFEELTILRREISTNGKSRAFVNDVPVTLQTLNQISSQLIDIHSQFQTANLFTDEFRYAWIDSVANQTKSVEEFGLKLKNWQSILQQIKNLQVEKAQFQKDFDYHQFLWNELEEADLDNLNLTELESEYSQLENADHILNQISESLQLIENEPNGLSISLNELKSKAKTLSQLMKDDNAIFNRVEALFIELKDIADELNFKSNSVEINPEKMLEVQQRINSVNHLMQKHNVNQIEDLIHIRDEINVKLQKGFSVEDEVAALTKKATFLQEELENDTKEISKKRSKVIPGMEKEILKSLELLGMPNTQISFELNESNTFNSWGKNELNWLFSANKGMPLVPIEKSVSGGERSRLMLSIKESVAKNQNLPTLILDEIDTGVSGKIAGSMGKIMSDAAKHLQIIAITHLPQVAAYGDDHLKVQKSDNQEQTVTSIKELNAEEKVNEIAQMLSGNKISEPAILQAKELIKNK